MPYTPPQSIAEGKDPGVTFFPHSHKHSAYRLFQVIRRIKTHPNPELLCSKSIYNFSHLSLEVNLDFKLRSCGVRGCPQCNGQWLVSLHGPVGRAGMHFWRQAVSHPSGGVALSTLTLGAQAVRMMGLCSWRKSPKPEEPRKTTPGISKWFDPSLVTKEEGGRGAYSSFKNPEATALLPRKGGKKLSLSH